MTDFPLANLTGVDYSARWDDLRFPATAVNPPGVTADPDWDTTTPGWLFDGASTTEILHLIAQLPHSWDEGTTLKPHVHYQKTTSASGTVRWVLEYKWCPIGEVMDADWTTLEVSAPVAGTPDTDTADKHLIAAFGDIVATGKQVSDMLIMKLSRDPSQDTYGADARLLEFDIHYKSDATGSVGEYIKQNVEGFAP